MAGNSEILNFPLLSAPIGSETYVVKTDTDYRLPVGSALGLATLGVDGKLDAAQRPTGPSGTVTSVGITPGAGVSVTGSPVTTSGNIALDLSANLQAWHLLATSAKANTDHTHAATDLVSGTVATARLGSGTADTTTFLRGDNVWATPAGGGTGDVVGPATAVNGNVALFDLTTGKLIKDGGTLGTAAFTASTAYATSTHTHPASAITSGVLSTARLGTGVANSTVYLRGDGAWVAAPGGGGAGTVTSVGISASSGGIFVAGGPITGAGTLDVSLSANLVSWSGIAPATKANLSSPALTGTPTAPTVIAGSNDTSIATTAWVKSQGYGVGGSGTVTSVGASVPIGFTMSGSPVTTSGTLAITYTAGYQGYTSAEASKLAGVAPGATANTGTVTSVGVSPGTGFAVSGSPVTSSGLISITHAGGYQGYTSTEASKLAGIAAGATANAIYVQATDPGAVAANSLWIW